MAEVSLRAYARHRGVSLKAVQKALASGRIHKTASGQIDVEAADRLWESRTAPRPQKVTATNAAPLPSRAVPTKGDEEDHRGRIEARGELAPGPADYARARAIRENYLARITKIEYEELSGKLVSGDEVRVAAFNKFRTFRNAMLNIPDRI